MKTSLNFLFLLFALCLLQSCISIKEDLPKDLPTSLLLIEKMDDIPISGKGLRRMAAKKASKRAITFNKRLVSKYSNYPFDYKIVFKSEIGDYLDSSRQVYLLRNGSTETITTKTYSTKDNSKRTTTSTKTEVILEDLVKNSSENLANVSGGLVGISKVFVKKTKKQFANKVKKTKKR